MGWLKKSETDRRSESLDEDEEARTGLIDSTSVKAVQSVPKKNLQIFYSSLIAVLILTNLAWAVVCLVLWHDSILAASCTNRQFSADFVSPEPLPYRTLEINFDDLLQYNKTNHEVYREMDSTLPRYFGKPDPAIDAAWARLLQYEYPAISIEEMTLNPSLSFQQGDKHPATGKHYFALDVFHNLHCLNAVRKELDKDYYGAHHHGNVGKRAEGERNHEKPKSSVEAAQRDHIDHCMNHIRQSLQCRPDLTPAAMHVFEDTDGSQFFLGNARRHTCYDWDGIMSWANARQSGLGFASFIA